MAKSNATAVKNLPTVPQVEPNKPEDKVSATPIREYLDTTVTPLLHEGLTELAELRPEDPVQYLAEFLLQNKHRVYELKDTSRPL
eukprot:CFRG4780T1